MFEKLRYLLCGLAMGAADVVPGVSGGTIAYITGIYDQLLGAVKSFDATFFRLFFTGRWKQALGRVPWGFLLPLLLGVGTSIFSLARLTLYLLKTHPVELWSFFFGLILASIVLMSRGRSFRGQHYAVMAVGAASATAIMARVTGVSLHLNSIGCPTCRAAYNKALKEFFYSNCTGRIGKKCQLIEILIRQTRLLTVANYRNQNRPLTAIHNGLVPLLLLSLLFGL